MIIIRKKTFYIFSLLTFLNTGFIGIFSYRLLMMLNEKVYAEKMLFCAIVVMILLFSITLSTIAFSRRKTRIIEKMAETVKSNGILVDEKFLEFGKIGLNLRVLYNEILEISQKRANRIYFLNKILLFLTNILEENLVITDVKGCVLYSTNNCMELLNIEEKNLAGRNIQDILPEVDLPSILQEVEKEHQIIEIRMESISADAYPIFSQTETTEGFCIIFRKLDIVSSTAKDFRKKYEELKTLVNTETKKVKKGGIKSFFSKKAK